MSSNWHPRQGLDALSSYQPIASAGRALRIIATCKPRCGRKADSLTVGRCAGRPRAKYDVVRIRHWTYGEDQRMDLALPPCGLPSPGRPSVAAPLRSARHAAPDGYVDFFGWQCRIVTDLSDGNLPEHRPSKSTDMKASARASDQETRHDTPGGRITGVGWSRRGRKPLTGSHQRETRQHVIYLSYLVVSSNLPKYCLAL